MQGFVSLINCPKLLHQRLHLSRVVLGRINRLELSILVSVDPMEALDVGAQLLVSAL